MRPCGPEVVAPARVGASPAASTPALLPGAPLLAGTSVRPIAPPGRSRRGAAALGKLRYVVEQTFALHHQFKRLAVRWERRLDLHGAFVSLGCTLICWRRLKRATT